MTGTKTPIQPLILHASAVSFAGHGLLILGPSGSGKSGLALMMMALGADLVADDRTEVFLVSDRLLARCPSNLAGIIEARGIGILRAPTVPETEVTLVVDLGGLETERLPPRRSVTILGKLCPLVLASGNDHFPASVLCYLKGSRHA